MTALYLVVPLALVVSAAAVWAFVWSVKHGQMDDLETPALRMLEEDQADAAERSERLVSPSVRLEGRTEPRGHS